jgi:carbon monoxide dehydrogenase subunit G
MADEMDITVSTVVGVPIGQVFEYLCDPHKRYAAWPSLLEATDFAPLPKGGYQFRFTFCVGPAKYRGTSRDTERVSQERIVTHVRGGVSGRVTYTCEPLDDDSTKLTVHSQLQVAEPLMVEFAKTLIARHQKWELDSVVNNLKAALEHNPSR